jgi:hypothetical protein
MISLGIVPESGPQSLRRRVRSDWRSIPGAAIRVEVAMLVSHSKPVKMKVSAHWLLLSVKSFEDTM